MKLNARKAIAAAAAVAAAQFCHAWALFGSSAGNAAGRLRSADRLLEKADTAFDDGKFESASNAYARVMEKLQAIERDYPGFDDGIALIRMDYCDGQIRQCAESLALLAPAPPADAGLPLTMDHSAATPAARPAQPKEAASDPESAAAAFRTAAGEAANVAAGDGAPVAHEEAAPYNPRYFSYDFSEARELVGKGRHADAIDILLPMVKFDPDNRQVRMLLAAARIGTGQPELAIDTLEDLRGRREDLPLLLLLSAAYTSAGRYPEALLSLDGAAKLAPGDPDAFFNLAWLTLLMDESDPGAKSAAERYYDEALRRGCRRDNALENALGRKSPSPAGTQLSN